MAISITYGELKAQIINLIKAIISGITIPTKRKIPAIGREEEWSK